MTRYVRLNELLLGVEGTALFRRLVECDDDFARARIEGIRRAVGLDVVDCAEAPMKANFDKGLFAGAKDAAEALWDGLPFALVWTLEPR